MIKQALQRLTATMAALALAGCVTSSSGGYMGNRSEEQALRDYLQLSSGYLEQGDLSNARRHLRNALDIDPSNSEAYGIQGLVYSRQGDLELADESFRRALRLDRDNNKARNNYAAFLYAQERYEEAYRQLQRVVEDPDYRGRAQAFENLGLAALRLDRPEEAEQAFGRALRLDANRQRARLELTALYLGRGEAARARKQLRDYLALRDLLNQAPTPRALWLGIQLERALGNDARAREYAQTLESLYEHSAEYQFYRQSLNDE